MECESLNSDEYFASVTIQQAKIAYDNGEIPVGAVVVVNNEIIGMGYNQCEENKNSLYHAEVIAISEASKKLNSKYFSGATIYTSLEPCMMCLGYINLMKFDKVIYIARDEKYGVCGGWQDLSLLKPFGNTLHITQLQNESLIQESSQLITDFFSTIREQK